MIRGLCTGRLVRRIGLVTLVDALGPPYYHNGHLPNAVNIPPHRVQHDAPNVLPAKDAEIVVYGNDGQSTNAHIVIEQLTQLGYSNVSLYVDGIEGWVSAGLPTEATKHMWEPPRAR